MQELITAAQWLDIAVEDVREVAQTSDSISERSEAERAFREVQTAREHIMRAMSCNMPTISRRERRENVYKMTEAQS